VDERAPQEAHLAAKQLADVLARSGGDELRGAARREIHAASPQQRSQQRACAPPGWPAATEETS
jgi:hypothetical protein